MMSLSLRELEEEDALPEPEWAKQVVAVVHAEGRLTDDDYDDFVEWMEALAEATRGAIHDPMSDEFTYIWPGVEQEETVARTRALLGADDFQGLARWVHELSD